LDLQETPKPTLLLKKRTIENNVAIFKMKEEDEEGEKGEKVGKNWADGEVQHLNALQGETEFEFTKNTKKESKFQFIETLEFFLDLIFSFFSLLKLGNNDSFESKIGKKIKIELG